MPAPAANRFERLRQQELRVASVSYRLSVGNPALCQAAMGPQPGFVLHGIEQYGPDDRQDAARNYGLGQDMGVLAVVADSPAARSGLVAGDRLISINRRILAADATAADGPETQVFVERARRIVLEEMSKGAVTLRVASSQGTRDLRLLPDAGCAYSVELLPSRDVNAWADGRGVVVTSAIVDQSQTDDDLALVIGHELAHDILRHRQRLALRGIADSRLLPVSAAGSLAIRQTEEEADQLGVRLASTAGYDLGRAAEFLNRLLETSGASRSAASTHPAPVRRLALIAAAIADTNRQAARPSR